VKVIEKLYTEYKQDVYGYLLHLTKNPILAEDLLQETFIKSITAIGSFKGQSSIKTWLFGIARNIWLQSLRQDKPQLEYNDLLEIYVKDSVEDGIAAKEIMNKIKELLSQKDIRTQRIIHMRVEGISYMEIAETLGISENSARVIDFRTKKWLKSILKKEGLA
jgi:RNA polymerase sigma factor (sigma-70 family)